MNFNALQKYLLVIYAILILALIIIVPTFVNGQFTYGFIFVKSTIGVVAYSYLIIELVTVTLAAIAALLATKDSKRK
jgi:hypothetical protein